MRILLVFGTRPEAIKMAPVIRALMDKPGVEVGICVTAQHREMLDQVLQLYSIRANYDLNIMRFNQDLTDITSSVILGLRPILKEFRPDYLLVHGDTTTTFASSLAAYYEKIPVGHVEAGLRTGDIYSPWPEELNRKLVASIAKIHFAPTKNAKNNLLAEGVCAENIVVTGNTVIDSLYHIRRLLDEDHRLCRTIMARFAFLDESKKLILVTVHRRENFGEPLRNICEAILYLSINLDVEFLIPIHPNPNVEAMLMKFLQNQKNIHLVKPLEYLEMVHLMNLSAAIMTDSGGLQEEAPSLGKQVFVLRDSTERPEALDSGLVRLVGSDSNKIISEVTQYLKSKESEIPIQEKMRNPFGDGRAAVRIVQKLTGIQVDPL
jgi:UDP-N-acetylglucosamine 2-epimerase (non-hydrolysing)